MSTSADSKPKMLQLSPEQVTQLLHDIGKITTMMAVVFLIYGIYLAFTLLSMHVLLTRGILKSKARRALFLVAVFELLISTTYVVLIFIFNAYTLLAMTHGPDPEWLQHFASVSTRFSIGIDFTTRLNFLLSDGIVVWRTWVLYPEQWIVRGILLICMLISCVCTFVDAGLKAARELRDVMDTSGGPAEQSLLMALPLLFTNLVAVSLIGYKTWSHRKDVQWNLMTSDGAGSRVQKILWLLIESGLIYCVIWVSYIVVEMKTAESKGSAEEPFSSLLYTGVTPLLAALFPVIVIFMAALEDSKFSDQQSTNGSPSSGSLTRSIQFASARAAESSRGHQRLDSEDPDGPLQVQSLVFEPLLLGDLERFTSYAEFQAQLNEKRRFSNQ
ncbi:hypothetical protein K435DRAFT_446618 [Dendrothele bispora CBS 962.96]|uniref:Uncharacterized protein n=1 Tax=Dendrothele bispora (strain CBS 962.96) TaxID=1314807 RepID=A0A4S8MD30_DENBC|nr:hypothetical protein K435DRAFT_446618 [Dendrothele bispora CBS 962.96]